MMKKFLCVVVFAVLLLTGCENEGKTNYNTDEELVRLNVQEESGNVREWSFNYLNSLFDDRNIPVTIVGNYKINFDEKSLPNQKDNGLLMDILNEGQEWTYLNFFGKYGGYSIGIRNFAPRNNDNDYVNIEGTKSADFCNYRNSEIIVSAKDLKITEEWIKSDIESTEYGKEILEIVHILYGTDFEGDIAKVAKKFPSQKLQKEVEKEFKSSPYGARVNKEETDDGYEKNVLGSTQTEADITLQEKDNGEGAFYYSYCEVIKPVIYR